MAWEYKITKSSLGYKIYRKKEEDGIMKMEWLQRNGYTLNIENARTFYTINDATSALVIQKIKDNKGIEKPKEPPKKIKTTWSSS